ncbi:MAG: C40 family peptidase [Bacteroidia bacterium]
MFRCLLIGVFGLFLISCGSSRSTRTSAQADKALLDKYEGQLGERPPKSQLAMYRFIDAWYGVPHRLGGSSKQGVDCSGFIFQLYREVYQMEVSRTTSGLHDQSRRIGKNRLKTGDLVFFSFNGSKKVTHVGVYLQNGRFVHASTSKGVRIDHLNDAYYSKQQFFARRIR